ncbi:MAG: alpha/beta fold hydrolase [Gammaproteobacteria bacterium]|nr:alpha/beta fold hydrolase [Gammaproteobacteria bacterium]
MFGLLLTVTSIFATGEQTFTIKSSDGLLLTADHYTPHSSNTTPLIMLFHQAGSSRGEYIDIAPRLNKLGFNCIAVDLRSGDSSRGIDNETDIRASNASLSTGYADALPDVIAALQYAKATNKGKVIAWGSSYSAALVLKVAGDHPELVDGVLAFSPGEYFAHLGKSKTWIQDSAKNIMAPVFITSAKNEADEWDPLFKVIPSETKSFFIPTTAGRHGSKALWKKYGDSEDYWQAVNDFLISLLSR